MGTDMSQGDWEFEFALLVFACFLAAAIMLLGAGAGSFAPSIGSIKFA